MVRDKVTRQCPQTTTFEKKGEPKQIRTEVPLLIILTPYRWAKAAHKFWEPQKCLAFWRRLLYLRMKRKRGGGENSSKMSCDTK